MRSHEYDIQGRFLRIPYDWRQPTVLRARDRWYRKGGPMLAPKVFGWGWTLNLAHPGSQMLLVALLMVAIAAIASG